MQQVHDGKGYLTHHVDPAQRRVEFDTIEGNRLSFNERDIAKMQIAVAFAYPALLATLRKTFLAAGIFGLAGAPQCNHAALAFAIGQHGLQTVKTLKYR